METPLKDYSDQADYMAIVAEAAERRQAQVESALRDAFGSFIHTEQVEVVAFCDMTVVDLASALIEHPIVLKPLLAACNCAGRALERDVGLKNLNTYAPRLSNESAMAIAGYLKPFLPGHLAVPGLAHLDRVNYIDKEIRLRKGRWERMVKTSLNEQSTLRFRKRRFKCEGDWFEIDAAAPLEGSILFGIDVKRVEARKDIHKRTDEIVNKAAKLRKTYPESHFGTIIYYPFVSEHVNVQSRLSSPEIDAVAFAGESSDSVDAAVGLVLAKIGARK